MKKNIYFFLGTSAELIKIAPIIREFQGRETKFNIITSGQNRVNFEDLVGYIGKIKPKFAFSEKANKASPYHFLYWSVKCFISALVNLRNEFKDKNKNDTYFIIQGDTVSSTIGAICAKIYGLKLVHIESGDLSFNLFEPFPEEICRSINIRLADILFPPNEWAENNIKFLNKEKVHTSEDTIFESYHWAIKQKPIIKNFEKILKNLGKYYILILHRQEHVIFRKGWSKKVLELIINNANKNLNCVLLAHPLTVEIINSLDLGDKANKIKRVERLPFPDFTKLMSNAEFLASDGATNQQESYYMGKPLLALREYTEQTEGIGKNYVLAKGSEKIIKDFLKNYKKYKSRSIPLYVKPSKIVVDYLLNR